MARRQNPDPEKTARDWKTPLRYAALCICLLACAMLAIYCFHRVDQFLATDPRFRFAEPPASGEPSPSLRIEGAVYASADRLAGVFAADFGRSVHLLPIAERRRSLLAIDWVREATVSRQWPDRLVVRIEERTPVAFVHLASAGESPRTALIDEDGVILELPPRARFSLPVLTGLRAGQPQALRRQRVRLALRLLREIGPLAGKISEIDVSEDDNLKVTQPIEGKAAVLWMGDRNFLSRLQNFLAHYPEIHRRLPQAATFDLRLDDRITAVRDPQAPHLGLGPAQAKGSEGDG